ncbi:hypothetical protein BDY24DRAFT_402511 [Mrakia frigida]|uniref:F-box protein n=1 Tax=Mrakia frigida TaxID=29902 RepID=UPI003FCBF16C
MAQKRTQPDSEEEGSETENFSQEAPRPATKKPKGPRVKKVAVWKDIKKWNEGDDPLGRFPIEVLNLIISIDTNLDLRDHLALSGVCRFFRTCYRDVVFQVLFQDAFPATTHCFSDTFNISDEGKPIADLTRKIWRYNSDVERSIGPTTRALTEARNIILFNGKVSEGWGVPNKEWNGSAAAIKQAEDLVVLKKIIAKDRKDFAAREKALIQPRSKAAEAAHALAVAAYEAEVAADQAQEEASGVKAPYRSRPHNAVTSYSLGWKLKDQTAALLVDLKKIYGDQVDRPAVFKPSAKIPVPPIRDPWHSEWRTLVALHVNNPRIAATEAKKIYKVSDAELLTIPLVAPLATPKSRPRYFITSAVDALAVRSHGGSVGHQEYLIKMAERAEKAAATRERNGTTAVKTGRKIYHEWGGQRFWTGEYYDNY